MEERQDTLIDRHGQGRFPTKVGMGGQLGGQVPGRRVKTTAQGRPQKGSDEGRDRRHGESVGNKKAGMDTIPARI